MGHAVRPGLIGGAATAGSVRDGTLCLAASPTPGVVGAAGMASIGPRVAEGPSIGPAEPVMVVVRRESFFQAFGPLLGSAGKAALDEPSRVGDLTELIKLMPGLRKLRLELGETARIRVSADRSTFMLSHRSPGAAKKLFREWFHFADKLVAKFEFHDMIGGGRKLSGARLGGAIGSIAFIIESSVEAAKFFTSDEPNRAMSDLGVKIAVGAVKTALGAVATAGLLSGAAALATAAGATVAAPVLVVAAGAVVVGIAVGYVIDVVDEHFEITKTLEQWVRDQQRSGEAWYDNFIYSLDYQFKRWVGYPL